MATEDDASASTLNTARRQLANAQLAAQQDLFLCVFFLRPVFTTCNLHQTLALLCDDSTNDQATRTRGA